MYECGSSLTIYDMMPSEEAVRIKMIVSAIKSISELSYADQCIVYVGYRRLEAIRAATDGLAVWQDIQNELFQFR